MKRPNILLIHSDQHRADCLGANGHRLVQTPNLDRLAREGANFTHAFCPIPVCTPARASLLNGQWPIQHRCLVNQGTEAFQAAAEVPSFPQVLKEAGYYLGHVGKWHVKDIQQPAHFGFDNSVPEHDYANWRKEQGIPPRPANNRWFGEVDPYVQPEQSRLAWGATATIELLRHGSRQQPFFIRWDPSEPHLPNVPPEPYASMVAAHDIPPWPNFADPLVGKPYIQRQQRITWDIDHWTWQQWAPVVGRYLGEISLLDHQIGRLLDELDSLGLTHDTLVIYTSDHGDLCGSHGLIDKHFVMYDELVRVPLIMRWTGSIASGQRCEAFVTSAIDLASTFCAAAGSPVPSTFMGQSLLDMLARDNAEGRQDIFATYHGNQFGLYSQRMVRDRRWKLVWNASAEDELYHLESDPGELLNLAADPRFKDQRRRLGGRLIDWMEATDDRLLNTWTRRQLAAVIE